MVAVSPLYLYQWGVESTKGTAVAATKKMTVESLVFTPQDMQARPQIAKGLMLDNPGNELAVSRGTTWRAEGPLVYDDFQRWLSMAIKSGVAPTGIDPYTYAVVHDPTVNNGISAWTLERRVTEGSNAIDNEWAYCTLQQLRISGARDEMVRIAAEGFARRVQASTLTAGQAHPTIEIPPFALSKVYIDATWATLGATQLTGVNGVLSWEAAIRTGAVPIKGAEARSDLDFSHVERNGRLIGMDVRMRVLLDTSSGQYATEKTAAEAGTLRAVRIQMSGTQSRDIKIDALLKHRAGSLFQVDEEDGLGVFDLDLVSATDGTNAFGVTLVNKTQETV